jgi:hypothetical protein
MISPVITIILFSRKFWSVLLSHISPDDVGEWMLGAFTDGGVYLRLRFSTIGWTSILGRVTARSDFAKSAESAPPVIM